MLSVAKNFLMLFVFAGCFNWASAQIVPKDKLPKQPNPPRLVVDFADMLSQQEENRLEEKLKRYNDTTSSQILIVTLHSTQGYDAGDYATEIGHKWGVGGQAAKDNGIVVLVSDGKEESDGRRKTFIATGYGLEGVLNSITTKSIVDNYLRPNLQAGNFYQAFDATTTQLIKAAAGEYTAPKGYKSRSKGGGFPFSTIIIIAVVLIIIFSRGRGGGGGMMSRRGYRRFNNTPPIWWFPTGGGGGWSGGGGDSGGGGGFGGFGGGDFGGGGAGGDW
jgi:uncharacterized protein